MKWSNMIFILVLLVAAVSVDVGAYKILMIPIHARGQVFSSFAIAEGLVDGGHNVSLLIGENYRLDLSAGLRNRSELSIVRYRDHPPGMHFDYDAAADNLRKAIIESGTVIPGERSPTVRKMY